MIEMISCSLREHNVPIFDVHARQPLTSQEKDGMFSLATNAVCIPINNASALPFRLSTFCHKIPYLTSMDAISSSNFLILMIFLVIFNIFSLMFCSKRVQHSFSDGLPLTLNFLAVRICSSMIQLYGNATSML